MLTYFRTNQGPLIWFMLILTILGFVFMTGYGPVSFSMGSKGMFLIGDDKISESDIYSYAYKHWPDGKLGNIHSVRAELEAAYEKGDEAEIQKLTQELQQTQNNLTAVAIEMAWDRAMARDGLEIDAGIALAMLKKNLPAAQRLLGSDLISVMKGDKPTPRVLDKLDAAANQIQQDLHMLLYSAAITTPVNMIYGLPGGFHQGSVRATTDLVVLDAGAFSSMEVSVDESKLRDFYDDHKFTEAADGVPGYKTPDRLSLTILSAVSKDFTSKVEITVQELREHYESFKSFMWMDEAAEGEEAKPKPFIRVRDEVEADFRLTKASGLAKEHVEEALAEIKGGRDLDEVAREFNLRVDSIENILRSELDEVPGYDGAYGLTRSFDAEKGGLCDDVVAFDAGSALWRLEDKTEGESVSYDKVIDQVRTDFLRDARFAAARDAFTTFKTTFDATNDWSKAVNALTLDATSREGVSILGEPETVSLGLLAPDSEPEALDEDFRYLVQDALAAANDDSRHTTRVIDDPKNNRVLLLLVREVSRADKDANGKTFGESFKDMSGMLSNNFRGQIENQYRRSLFGRIRPLYN